MKASLPFSAGFSSPPALPTRPTGFVGGTSSAFERFIRSKKNISHAPSRQEISTQRQKISLEAQQNVLGRIPNEGAFVANTKLQYCGLHGSTTPFNRIRVWLDQVSGLRYFDCVCKKRRLSQELHNLKRHVYRHSVQGYICNICQKSFDQHWSLNAHKRIHIKAS